MIKKSIELYMTRTKIKLNIIKIDTDFEFTKHMQLCERGS